MTVKDEIEKQGERLAVEVLKAARNDRNTVAAGRELGKAALTVTKCINVALLPVAALNYGFEKARVYFTEDFEKEMAAKAGQIPPEHVVEPKASVAGPALQGLAFAHDEAGLRQMYLSLLATAMDDRYEDMAHPAFVEVIRQLTGQEAELLAVILRRDAIPIVELRIRKKGVQGWKVGRRHVIDLRDRTTGEQVAAMRIPEMVDNWSRLGLVECRYDEHLTDPDAYKDMESRPEVAQVRAAWNGDDISVSWERGVLKRTSFGAQFAQVVGLLRQDKSGPT